MHEISPESLAARRQLEDQLLELGAQHKRIEAEDAVNRQAIRRLLTPAREAGISILDIARMTHLSPQTLHTWIRDQSREHE